MAWRRSQQRGRSSRCCLATQIAELSLTEISQLTGAPLDDGSPCSILAAVALLLASIRDHFIKR